MMDNTVNGVHAMKRTNISFSGKSEGGQGGERTPVPEYLGDVTSPERARKGGRIARRGISEGSAGAEERGMVERRGNSSMALLRTDSDFSNYHQSSVCNFLCLALIPS